MAKPDSNRTNSDLRLQLSKELPRYAISDDLSRYLLHSADSLAGERLALSPGKFVSPISFPLESDSKFDFDRVWVCRGEGKKRKPPTSNENIKNRFKSRNLLHH